MSKRHKKGGIDISPLLSSDDEMFMWEYVVMAKFLNMSYEDVKNLPFDEFAILTRLKQISDYCGTEEGQEILKDNIRFMSVSPDVKKLRDRFGEEGENG